LSRRLLGDPILADDAVQEASLAALTGLEQLRSPERFGAWYAGIALNIARRWLRKGAITGPLPDGLLDSLPGPEEQAEAAEMAERVRQAVEVLPEGQREAVLAFYWQGLSHAEAAVELGITPGAVKARLHQARGALAPQLASQFLLRREIRPMTSTAEADWVEVEVAEVRRANGDDRTRRLHVIVLKQRGGSLCLPIYTGSAEAIALAFSLGAVEMPRPMTYQMADSLLRAAGSRVAEVRITRLVETTFFAVVVVGGRAGWAEVDARPSDALNLALVSGAPIRVASAIFDDPQATSRTAWQRFSTRESDLVAEEQQSREDLLASLAAEETCEPH
jgi:RNA polymerase sigma factor (sigma-70 family)